MEKTLHLKLLGEFSAEIRDDPSLPAPDPLSFAARRAEAMIAYLAITARPHAREKLATFLWDDRSQEQALANLRSLLAQLPQPLKRFLTINRQSVALNTAHPIWLDTAVFSHELKSASEQWPDETAVEQTEAALALYQGDFLEGVLVRESRGLEEWITVTAERFQHQAAVARHNLATYYLHRRDYANGIRHCKLLLRTDPLQESSHRLLMLMLARSGDRNAALAQYQKCGQILVEELGVEPAEETTALYERIRQARTPAPYHVPIQATAFIGRQAELTLINQQLDDPNCRLLTLTGPGGVGKTRLSIQAALERKGEFLHGIYFVPLAGTETAGQLPLSIAAILGFTFQDKSEPQQQLINYLRPRELLLILDNFEQLVEAGANFVGEILAHAPYVKLLITSRERLNIRAEWLLTLSGLSHPAENEEDQQVDNYEAWQLFKQCIRQHHPTLDLTGERAAAAIRICRMIEGFPLGIELVAASLAAHPISHVEAEIIHNLDFLETQMRDLPGRHRSLRAVFEHSWEMLANGEKPIFCRLSVFRGGFDGRAAQEVAGAAPADLAALTGKSLLRLTEADQYDMHEVLRQYTAEKLFALPDELQSVRTRHSHYYMEMLANSAAVRTGSNDIAALNLLSKELENIRQAWQWAATQRILPALEKGMTNLFHFYLLRGPFQEGQALFEKAITHLQAGEEPPTPTLQALLTRLFTFKARFLNELALYQPSIHLAQEAIDLARQTAQPAVEASAHHLHGRSLWRMGDYTAAKVQFQESLRLAQQTNNRSLEADALRGLGVLNAEQGDFRTAIEQYESALSIYREINDQGGEATTLNNLGNVRDDIGDYAIGQANLEQAVTLYRRLGNRKGIGNALNNLGVTLRHQSAHKEAAQYFAQALDTFREIGDRWREGLALINLSNIAIDQGEYSKAINLLQQSHSLFQEIEDPNSEGTSLALSGKVFLRLGLYSSALERLQQAIEKFEETGNRYSLGLSLVYLSMAVCHQGEYEAALTYGRKALAIAEEIKNRPVRGTAQAALGMIYLQLNQPAEAEAAYRHSRATRQEIGEYHLAIEATAGLVLVLLNTRQPDQALVYSEEILDFLQKETRPDRSGHPLDGVEDLSLIYLACYQSLAANEDERAAVILEEAYNLLQSRARQILDETLRQSFQERVASNRRILSLRS